MSQDSFVGELMPPPDLVVPATQSSQLSSSQRSKTRTPTPSASHMSTPPPTVDTQSQSQRQRPAAGGTMSADEVATASAEELRAHMMAMQTALHEAKTTAQHYRLQHTMLAQESQAALERMAVEARMAQYENDVIYIASEQHHAAQSHLAPSSQPPPLPEGTIPVQKELYQRLCQDVQLLTEHNQSLRRESSAQKKVIGRQEDEIASLSDKVLLMRERIRENREHLHKIRSRSGRMTDATPRSVYSTPQRPSRTTQDHSQQPFAALLQASEMARQEGRTNTSSGRKKQKIGHNRNTHSLSSLPVTPVQQPQKRQQQQIYTTPSNRLPPMKVPSTAPPARLNTMRTPDGGGEKNIYSQPALPVSGGRAAIPPSRRERAGSEGTISASEPDHEENNLRHDPIEDSEAETDILETEDGPDPYPPSNPTARGNPGTSSPPAAIITSSASRAATQILRLNAENQTHQYPLPPSPRLYHDPSPQQQQQQEQQDASFSRNPPRTSTPSPTTTTMRQTQLFGQVRKCSRNDDKDEGGEGKGGEAGRSKKRARTWAERGEGVAPPAEKGVGLGIFQGARN
ncbi:hypothetical protein KC332_g4764 [Hortaea werneckii]|uniref:Uncharacterized protein n=1 Tax=Hortaea werneckii EXF-2000 TaxID=1157616 RepID=A0A1Z5SNS9_HORWE|nr:hypothetical protein KC358_g4736 [Hortaea werneckii]OTA22463.1 hypothetical protein BTJ68_14807 [Hortaea werneckii EXF-2000]KAI6846632.1 hypothetical protein KC350_g3825 [Hortaea werneckii]KAI6934177.1 hypothetical protein KC348_g6572 [Hortaea werneckii]KAI6938908.1 hypothetical protein KC341_g4583 [Hortaea werneckii]